MKYEKYLPLGTIVILKNKKAKVMITGFNVMENNDNNYIYDYIGCIYPVGFIGTKKMILFNHSDVEKIYCIGYSDDEEKGFREILKHIMSKENT